MIVGLYLPYTPFEDWSYLRFFLPVYPSLFTGLSRVATEAGRRWSGKIWVAPAIALTVVLLTLRGLDYSNAGTDLAASEPRYRHVADAAKPSARQRDLPFVPAIRIPSLLHRPGHSPLGPDGQRRHRQRSGLPGIARVPTLLGGGHRRVGHHCPALCWLTVSQPGCVSHAGSHRRSSAGRSRSPAMTPGSSRR